MTELLEKELVYKIVGCAISIHNKIGHGFREKTYEKAICVEFEDQNLSYSQQMSYPIYYKNNKIDEFIPDLVVENKVIVEAKIVESIIDEHRGQLINYLRISGIKVGLIINFKHPKIQWERIILEKVR